MDNEYEGPDGDHYDNEIVAHSDTLKEFIDEHRWLIDFATLFTLYVAVTGILVVLIKRAFVDGLDGRLLAGLLVSSLFAWRLLLVADRAVTILAHALVARARQVARVPHTIEYRHAVWNAFWKAILSTAHIVGMLGLGLLFAEIVQSAGPL